MKLERITLLRPNMGNYRSTGGMPPSISWAENLVTTDKLNSTGRAVYFLLSLMFSMSFPVIGCHWHLFHAHRHSDCIFDKDQV